MFTGADVKRSGDLSHICGAADITTGFIHDIGLGAIRTRGCHRALLLEVLISIVPGCFFLFRLNAENCQNFSSQDFAPRSPPSIDSGTVYSIDCAPGYIHSASASRVHTLTCLPTGNWTTLPICHSKFPLYQLNAVSDFLVDFFSVDFFF